MAATRSATRSLSKLSQLPLVVILGSTGTGKSKLGIQIAEKFNGEIVSADSMQVYRGLDIITNKVTKAESKGCKHHLMDFVDPLKEFNVVSYRDKAISIIKDMNSRGKLPVIVGGTNYYIEAILWDILISDVSVTDDELLSLGLDNEEACSNIGDAHAKLQKVDPVMASRIHPNDVRKATRSLAIFRKTGKRHSDFISEQKEQNGDHLGGPLKFEKALVIWLTCNQEVLDVRLNNRVDDMMKRGLLKEISDFHKAYNEERLKSCTQKQAYSEGIFQAIGFKEFHQYLIKNNSTESDAKLTKSLDESIDALKRVTIKYSKKQNNWVRQRFLGRPKNCSPDVYEFSTTYADKWNETVGKPALNLVHEFLNEMEITTVPCARLERDTDIDKHRKHVCATCNNRIFIGDNTWKIHCSSKQHKKALSRKRKLEQLSTDERKSKKVEAR